jgi:LmbE family N-acetylglucosaminyl deacetylase
MLRIKIKELVRSHLMSRANREEAPDPHATTMVFAPHQDDETLGCGGVVAIKRKLGTEVVIVFMTNGNASHRRFMESDDLAALRRKEAIDACHVLGVDEENVRFLGFPDGRLGELRNEALRDVQVVLREFAPTEVFVPFRHDGPPDHEVTYQLISDAVGNYGLDARIFEYPIWFLNRWPWVPAPSDTSTRSRLKPLLFTGIYSGFFEMRRFRSVVPIHDVIGLKREALACHRSQVQRMAGRQDWPVLSDVSGGNFVECFFGEFELFRLTSYSGSSEEAIRHWGPGKRELTGG